jgi:hypothetical protein
MQDRQNNITASFRFVLFLFVQQLRKHFLISFFTVHKELLLFYVTLYISYVCNLLFLVPEHQSWKLSLLRCYLQLLKWFVIATCLRNK